MGGDARQEQITCRSAAGISAPASLVMRSRAPSPEFCCGRQHTLLERLLAGSSEPPAPPGQLWSWLDSHYSSKNRKTPCL